MAFGRFRKAREETEINLIPVMNLFVTMIPFLLLAAAFYHVGVVPTSFPSQTDKQSDLAADPKSVTVDLLVEKDKIELSASNTVLDEETLNGLALTVERKDGKFDYELLGKALYAIKQRFPNSDTVIVLPSDDIPYQDVIRVLDTAREITLNKGTPQEVHNPLFPVTVLSRKV